MAGIDWLYSLDRWHSSQRLSGLKNIKTLMRVVMVQFLSLVKRREKISILISSLGGYEKTYLILFLLFRYKV